MIRFRVYSSGNSLSEEHRCWEIRERTEVIMAQIFQLENHAVCSYSEAQLKREQVIYTDDVSFTPNDGASETRSEGFNITPHEVHFDR
jgi:hypothetical protein